MTGIGLYTIVTLCNVGGSLNDCKNYIGFGDMRPGYTQQMCVSESVALAEKWLAERGVKNRFVAGAVCHMNQERGA